MYLTIISVAGLVLGIMFLILSIFNVGKMNYNDDGLVGAFDLLNKNSILALLFIGSLASFMIASIAIETKRINDLEQRLEQVEAMYETQD